MHNCVTFTLYTLILGTSPLALDTFRPKFSKTELHAYVKKNPGSQIARCVLAQWNKLNK